MDTCDGSKVLYMSAMSPALVFHTPGRGELALLNVNLTLQQPYNTQESLNYISLENL